MASPLDDSSHFSNEELREKLNERGWSITKSYFHASRKEVSGKSHRPIHFAM